MQKKQHNKCGVCKKDITNNYTIDHCHKSNKIRGLLCRQCNTVLGLYTITQTHYRMQLNI
jgi:hypothetical protein